MTQFIVTVAGDPTSVTVEADGITIDQSGALHVYTQEASSGSGPVTYAPQRDKAVFAAGQWIHVTQTDEESA